MRSFIIEDEYDVDSNDEIAVMKLEIKKEMINKLASEWNSLNNKDAAAKELMSYIPSHTPDGVAFTCTNVRNALIGL